MTDDTLDDLIPPNPARWTPKQREAWTDIFMAFCDILLTGTVTESEGKSSYPLPTLKSDIKLAAELADDALAEMGYRFDIQHPPVSKTHTPRRPQAQRKGARR